MATIPNLGNTSSNKGAGVTTCSHTVAAGSNKILLVFTMQGADSTGPTAVSWNGHSLTKKLSQNSFGEVETGIWYLVNPEITTADITVTSPGSRNHIVGTDWNDCSQASDPLDSATGTVSGVGLSKQETVTSTAADTAMVGAMGTAGGTSTNACTPDGGQTDIYNQVQGTGGNGCYGLVAYKNGSTGGATVGWTTVSNPKNWSGCAVAILPFTAVGPAGVKTWDGVTQATGIKTYKGVAVASVKSVEGVT